MKIFMFLFTVAWLAASCTAGKPDSSPLERALQAAGENRGELEKVLALRTGPGRQPETESSPVPD